MPKEQSGPPAKKKTRHIESGSVNAEDLSEDLAKTNPETKAIIYRQGSTKPELVDVKKRH